MKRKFKFSYSTRSDFRHIVNRVKRSLIQFTCSRQNQLIRPRCPLSMDSALGWRQKSVNWLKVCAIPILQSALQKLLWVLLLTSEIYMNFVFEINMKKEKHLIGMANNLAKQRWHIQRYNYEACTKMCRIATLQF